MSLGNYSVCCVPVGNLKCEMLSFLVFFQALCGTGMIVHVHFVMHHALCTNPSHVCHFCTCVSVFSYCSPSLNHAFNNLIHSSTVLLRNFSICLDFLSRRPQVLIYCSPVTSSFRYSTGMLLCQGYTFTTPKLRGKRCSFHKVIINIAVGCMCL